MSAGLLRLYWFYPAGIPQSGVVTGDFICDFDDNTRDAAFDVDQGDLLVARALVESGLIVEVTHRSTRRLFALQDMPPYGIQYNQECKQCQDESGGGLERVLLKTL